MQHRIPGCEAVSRLHCSSYVTRALRCDSWAHADANATCNSDDETTSCHLAAYADAKLACSSTCEASNGTIMAHATHVDLDADDDELFEDLELELELDQLLDSDGNVIDLD